jgi:hypothetical protein
VFLLYFLGGVLFMQRRDADHEEFIKVGKKDREELDPLQERPIGPARLGEDPAIERQPRQLAIEVERRVRPVRFRQEFAGGIARSFRHRRRIARSRGRRVLTDWRDSVNWRRHEQSLPTIRGPA